MSRFLAALLAATFAVPGAALAADAAATVKAFYVPTVWNPLEGDDLSAMTGAAKDLFEKSAKVSAESGEMGCIDFVVTVAAQDYDEAEIAKTVTVADTATEANGDHTVVATFKNFGSPQTITWTMRPVGGAWKVADIASGDEIATWVLAEMSCG